jgi:hypothetical protein
MYYRYYHDPATTTHASHYGVAPRTHKLIYFWKKDQWELFDLVNDPQEMHNLYGQPGQEAMTASLKAELAKLKKAMKTTISSRTSSCQTASTGPPRSCEGNESTMATRFDFFAQTIDSCRGVNS